MTLTDYVQLLRYIFGRVKWLPCLKWAADADENRRVPTIQDAQAIREAAGF